MGDLIDRDSVIKATCDYCDRQGHCDEICAEVELIKEVPSVQPTHKTPSNTLGALDCIERQKAIEAIEEMQKPIMRSNFSHEQFIFRGMSEARQAIIDLPSVRPRKGKWIRWHETLEDASGVEYIPRCKCSECGEEYEAHSTRFINFCPNCGADMREGDSE